MLNVSKYAINPQDLLKFSDKELENYIKKSSKVINNKLKRINKTDYAVFSELYSESQTVRRKINLSNDDNFGYLSGATKSKSRSELETTALQYNVLSHISETPKQIEREWEDNVKSIFKEPRFTKEFLDKIYDNKELLLKIITRNESFIRDILPSDTINKIMEESDNSEDAYYNLIMEVTETLDNYDEKEKEKILEEWKNPEEFNGVNWK